MNPRATGPSVLYAELASAARGAAVTRASLEAAKGLLASEKSLRAAVLCGVLQLKAGQLTEAEATLRAALTQHGAQSAVLVNLGKVAQLKGDPEQAAKLGLQALQLAPNDEVALGWWSSLLRLMGKDAELSSELAKLGGWRPRLTLAQYHLEKQAYAEAEAGYAKALEASSNARACVELVARDLRATDRHAELTRLLAGRWQLAAHGPYVALALARAWLCLKKVAEAEALLAVAKPELGPDAAAFLGQLEALRAKASAKAESALSSVPITGALWADTAKAVLTKLSREKVIAFAQLADCTAKREPSTEATFAPAAELEIACRAIPLCLSEAVSLGTDATGQALIATATDQGLVSFTEHLELEAALPLASAKTPPRVLVTGFFSKTVTDALQLDLIAYDVGGTGKVYSVTVASDAPAALAARAERDLLKQLERAGVLQTTAPVLARPELSTELFDVQHQVLVKLLTEKQRIDPKLQWGGGAKLLDAALQLARANPEADTPALLALAALAADPSRNADVQALLAAHPKLSSLKVPA